MLKQMGNMLHSGAQAISSQAEATVTQLRQLGIWCALLTALGLVGGAALCGILAAGVLLLAPHMGVAVALLVVSSVAVICTIGTLWGIHLKLAASARQAREQAQLAREQLLEQLTPDEPASNKDEPHLASSLQTIVQKVASNPEIVASGAFAAMSVLGVRRSAKIVRAGIAMASTGAAVAEVARSAMEHHRGNNGSAAMNGTHGNQMREEHSNERAS